MIDHSVEGFISGMLFSIFIFTVFFNAYGGDKNTAIQDSGCAKPTQLELTPPVYNTWPNNKGVM